MEMAGGGRPWQESDPEAGSGAHRDAAPQGPPSRPGEAPLAPLADLVGGAGLFVLTGAGLSTESGIPDYRRPDGTRRTVPMTFQQFASGEPARRRYWSRSAVGWERFAAARANEGHRAVARWQRAGLVDTLVTQNVDGLHQEAGARGVCELHGSLAWVRCVECGARETRPAFQERLRRLNPALPQDATLLADGDAEVTRAVEETFVLAPCLACGTTFVKPDVVMFGESVDAPIVESCFAAVERAHALVVLGSSLKVMSGYRFVRRALELGTPVALVGLGEMRGEQRCDLVVRGPLGRTLSALDAPLGLG